MSIKIAFFDAKTYDKTYFNKINRMHQFEINYIESKLDRQSVVLAEGHDVVCAFVNDTIDKYVIEKIDQYGIRLIALRCSGFNNIDFQATFNKVHVVRVPDYSPRAVAEHAIGLLLSINRKIHKAYNRTREGNFSLSGLIGFDLYKKTAGVIGVGKIGKALVNILNGFGMNVLGNDTNPDMKLEENGKLTYVDKDSIYLYSDIIFLNCPLTKDTYHMIGDSAIKRMKEGAIIINTGRGGLIDSLSLINGLKEQKLGGAGLDVYEEEDQYFFEDFSGIVIEDDVLARLLTFNNVIVTSHQGYFTKEALTNIAETTLVNISEFFKGGYFPNEICYQCSSGDICPKQEDKKETCFEINLRD